jgi:hypothetical protein
MPDYLALDVRLTKLTYDLDKLRKENDLPDFGFSHAHYVLAYFSDHLRGKSGPLSTFGSSFDFTKGGATWTWKLLVAAGSTHEFVVQIWCDRGDEEAVALWEHTANVECDRLVHETLQAMTVDAGGVKLELLAHAIPLFSGNRVVQATRSTSQTATDRLITTVANRWMIVSTIAKVEGLHKPRLEDGSYRGYDVVADYISDDDAGRIYLEHEPDGTWHAGAQWIRLTASVAALNGVIPDDAHVIWTVEPLNDASDDNPDVHRDSALLWDPTTYQSPYGARPHVEGKVRNPPWEEVDPYALRIDDTKRKAATAIVLKHGKTSGVSQVILHCPNVGGDSFRITTTIFTKNDKAVVGGQGTGVMTMWKRVNVECVRMKDAFPLPVADVADYFWLAFIQLDVAKEWVDEKYNLPWLTKSKENASKVTAQYVEAAFSQKGKPDWFCLVAARKPFDVSSSEGKKLYEGGKGSEGVLDQWGTKLTFDLPGDWKANELPAVGRVLIAWGDASPAPQLSFNVFKTELSDDDKKVNCFLIPHDIVSDFTGADADGSLEHAYAKTRRHYVYAHKVTDKDKLIAGGYEGVPKEVRFRLFGKSSSYEMGVSPTVAVDGKNAFAGRTIVFTHHGAVATEEEKDTKFTPRDNYDASVLATITHELTHAFGMPHKCGAWNWKAPREKTCSLNYSSHGMLRPDGKLDSTSAKKGSPSLCGPHAKQLRYVQLSKNIGLGWK